MASGLTHILLTKKVQDKLPDNGLKDILAYSADSFQVGAVAPDLPYASIVDNDFFFANESALADKFHYEKTNEIPVRAMKYLRLNRDMDRAMHYQMFAFFLGYISHVIADGVIHPFVRDKVGEYSENQSDHRSLEMQLDVLFFDELTKHTGLRAELNYTNMHDEILNFLESENKNDILRVFSSLIRDTYDLNYTADKISGWVKGLYRLFEVAEGDYPRFYRILESNSLIYRNVDDIDREKAIILMKPKDREVNFLDVEKIDFFNDCVPKYYERFIEIALKAYAYVFDEGEEITELDIPLIDLDTGRLLVNNNLDQVPELWK